MNVKTNVAKPGNEAGSATDIDQWLSRSEVATCLRVSIATVRRLEGRELHPRRSDEGFYMFDPHEVEEARARRPPPPEPRECRDPGDLAAEAFKLLRDGVDVRDLVIALRRPPKEVEALHEDWQRMGNAIVVSARVRLVLAQMVGHDLISSEMVEAIEADDADTLRDLVSEAVEDG